MADSAFALDQHQILAPHMSRSRQMSQVSSHYPSPYDSPQMQSYGQSHTPSRKRSRQEDFFDYQAFHQTGGSGYLGIDLSGQGQAMQPSAMQYPYSPQQTSPCSTHSRAHSIHSAFNPHHHHGLPTFPDALAGSGYGGDTSPSLADEDHGPPSVVGQPGMPDPAPRPKGPKLKFTPEDDALLVELKETKNLTWKQIADFFPGRSSGTLQVRYCTKLKAKTTMWTDEMVQKLRGAYNEYETDRWRIIAGKVGNGFSWAACRDKAAELDFTLDGAAAAASSASGGSTPGEGLDGMRINISSISSADLDLRSASTSTDIAITPPSSLREGSVALLSMDPLDDF